LSNNSEWSIDILSNNSEWSIDFLSNNSEWSIDLLSNSSEGVEFSLSGEDIKDISVVVQVLFVVLAIVSVSIDLGVDSLCVKLVDVDGVEQVVDGVVLWDDSLLVVFVEDVVQSGVQVVVVGGWDMTSVQGVDIVDIEVVSESTEHFWNGHSIDLGVVLVLTIQWLVFVLTDLVLSELNDDWEDVLVEEDGVNKEILEHGLCPVLLEGGTDNVPLESWYYQELTEEWDVVVLLEQGHGVHLTEGIGEDVGGNVDLLSRWLDKTTKLTCCGHVSVDCLLQLLNVVVQGTSCGNYSSTLVLTLLVLLLTLVYLTLWVHCAVPQVVNHILVYSCRDLTAHSGNQHNCNKSLHDDD